MTTGYSLGIDVGGTFTDVVCRGRDSEIAFKTPTTPDDHSRAVADALTQLKAEYNVSPAEITRFAHGTTVSTNSVIERTGARVGLIMTEGFGDTIEIGRQISPSALRPGSTAGDAGVVSTRRATRRSS